MHIPDGFLSPPVWATLDAMAIPAVAWIANRAQKTFAEEQAPLLGVMGAFVFAAQMINFPVGIGTSGHLVGGALLAFTVGPSAASIVLTAILVLQSLIFQDGGVLALGANVTNMALAGVLVAYLPLRLLPQSRKKTGYFLGAALSLMVSAVLALSELLISGVRMPGSVFGLSLALFAISAVIEGAITVAVMQSLEAINPGFVRETGPKRNTALQAILLTAVLMVTIGVLAASTQPDGIWSLAGKIGIDQHAQKFRAAPLADYSVNLPGGNGWFNRAIAGIIGLVAVYIVCFLISRLMVRRRVPAARSV